MKKLFLLSVLTLLCFSANAQFVVYEGFNPKTGQTFKSNQPSSEIVRTTAYSRDNNGAIIKTPIKVEVKSNGDYKIVSRYVSTIMGGQWETVLSVYVVSKCSPYTQESLEKQFMYKATNVSTTYYFDL